MLEFGSLCAEFVGCSQARLPDCSVIVHCLLFYLCKMGLHLSISAAWTVLRYIVYGHDIGKIQARDASDEARAHS